MNWGGRRSHGLFAKRRADRLSLVGSLPRPECGLCTTRFTRYSLLSRFVTYINVLIYIMTLVSYVMDIMVNYAAIYSYENTSITTHPVKLGQVSHVRI